jgi:uncharacterized protein (DUF1499 family)
MSESESHDDKALVAQKRKKRVLYLAIVIIVLLVPVIFLAVQSALAKRPDNLGVHNGRLADCPASPNCVCTQSPDPQHHIEPIPFKGPPSEMVKRIKGAITSVPRTKIISENENYIHAEATSLIFRFVDDVEIFVDKDAQQIHFRSASRVGHSDLGANRSRMEKIRAAFQSSK